MALMNLYSDPYRTPNSAMNIAAVAQLLSSVLGGVEDWKRRKMDERRYQSEQEYQGKVLSLREAAERESTRRYNIEQAERNEPIDVFVGEQQGAMPGGFGVPGYEVESMPRHIAESPAILAQQAQVLGAQDKWYDRLMDERRMALAESQTADPWGGADRKTAEGLLMNLDEMMAEFEADWMMAGEDADLQAKAEAKGSAIARRIEQVKSMLPNRVAIEGVEDRIGASTSREQAQAILDEAANSGVFNPLEQMYLRTVTPYATRQKPATVDDYMAQIDAAEKAAGATTAPPIYTGGFGQQGYITGLLKALGIEPQFHWERFNIGR